MMRGRSPNPSPETGLRVGSWPSRLLPGLILVVALLTLGMSCQETTAPTGPCLASPALVEFGTQPVGSRANRTVYVRNTGTESVVGTVSLDAVGFALLAGAGDFTLAPGEELPLTVQFAPVAAGRFVGSVDLGGACEPVDLAGTAARSEQCEVTPGALAFGTLEVGTSTSATFVVSNPGSGTLTGAISLPDCAEFSVVSGDGPFALEPGQVREVVVRYQPQQTGAHQCTLSTGLDRCPTVELTGTAIPSAECAVEPPSLAFGAVGVGASATRTLTLRNTGGRTLSGVARENCPAYQIIAGGGAYALTPGESHQITVRFSPPGTGSWPCLIDLGSACANVAATGTGVAAVACQVSTTSLDFGTLDVGSTRELTFDITNTGTQPYSGTVSAACPGFSVVSGGGDYTLSSGAVRTVRVRFAPTDAGPFSCTVSTGCQDVSLSGSGQHVVACSVSPGALNFGNVSLGTNAERSFTLTNTGTGVLNGTIAAGCETFSVVSGGGAYALAPGGSRNVTVRFTPAGLGAVACKLETGTACDGVELSGTGVGESVCVVTPGSLDFGTVTVGATADRSFTVRNDGNTSLSGNVVSNCAQMTVIQGGGAFTLNPAQTRNVTVRFAPTAPGQVACEIGLGTGCSPVAASGTGQAAPACSVSVASIDYGTVTVGTTRDRSFTISNSGGGTLSGSVSLACTGYSIVNGGGAYALTAGQSRTVTVRFAPGSSGNFPCAVNTGTSCVPVNLSGVGSQPTACVISPGELDFGTVQVGSSKELTFRVENTGGGTLSGTISESCPDFTLVSGGGAYSLSGGQFRDVTVRFTPSAPGPAACEITTGTACNPVSASGAGEAAPVCQLSTSTLDFGTVPVGQSADLSFTVTNAGGGTLSGSVSESCADYTLISGGGAFALGAGQSKTVTVRFTPGSAGVKPCNISVTPCGSVSATGTGEAVPVCSVTPTTLNFGSVTVGNSADRTFRVKNTGGGVLSGTISEACADYSIVSGGGDYALAAGDSVVVTLRFTPASEGQKQCAVSTGGACPAVSATGTGVGVPGCAVNPTTLAFGNVTVGSTKTLDFTIENTGGGTLSGTVSEACTDYQIISGGGAYALAAGQKRTVSVRFAPTSTGTKECDIITGTSCPAVKASGTGELPPGCAVAPPLVEFGKVVIGTFEETTVKLINNGGGTIAGTVSLLGCSGEFTIESGGGSYALSAGQERDVVIRFSPSSPGLKACVLETGSALCADVPLSGEGEPAAVCTLSETSLDFGTVTTGTTKDLSFTITNTGGSLLTGSVTESCPDFSIVSGSGPFVLAAGQQVTVTVRFAPSSSGPAAACSIETGTACADVPVSGVGELPPSCTVEPASLAFGVVQVGSSKDETFVIRNDGEGTLTGSVSETCGDYAVISGGGAFSLGANDSVVVTVRYTPSSSGAAAACSIETGTACVDVPVTGTGELPPSCTVEPASLAFGVVQVGTSKDTTFVIRNDGEGTLTGTVSETCGDYAVISGSGAFSLGANDSVVVTVRYTPSSSGAAAACSIETGTNCADVPVTGTGELPPSCTVEPASLAFGVVQVGSSKDTTFVIRNDGEGTLTGTVSETCADYAVISGGGAFSLGANDSVVVTVRYTPSSSGAAAACSIETGTNCADVPVTGTGELPPSCTVEPASLAFGVVQVGSSKDTTFVIRNDGEGTLTGTVSETCADFAVISGGGAFSLGANDSVAVTVRYTPSGSGPAAACNILTGTNCADVPVTGTGELPPACTIVPVAINFGQVDSAAVADTTFTIYNTGGGFLTGAVADTCAEFSILSGEGAFNIAGGDSLVVTVRFAPLTLGAQSCVITTGASCPNVTLDGEGVSPP